MSEVFGILLDSMNAENRKKNFVRHAERIEEIARILLGERKATQKKYAKNLGEGWDAFGIKFDGILRDYTLMEAIHGFVMYRMNEEEVVYREANPKTMRLAVK